MKNLLPLIALLFFSTAYAQPSIMWQKTLGGSMSDAFQDVSQTTDSGYICIGNTSSSDGDVSGYDDSTDVWVVKLTKTGSIQWQKCYGGSKRDLGYKIHQTSDGGFLFLASTASNDGDVSGNIGQTDVWVVKLTSTGAITWQKTFGGTKQDASTISVTRPSMTTTSDGGCIFIASTTSNDGDVTGNHSLAGFNDMWVVKLAANGDVQWRKCFGGSHHELGCAVIETKDGNYMLLGGAESDDGDLDKHYGFTNKRDIWVIKIAANSNLLWQKNYGGSDEDMGLDLVETPDNKFLIAGYTNSSDSDVSGYHDSTDIWIIQIDGTGTIEWSRALGGSGREYPYSIKGASDGCYIAAFSTSNDGDVSGSKGAGDAWLVHLYPNGTTKWAKTTGGTGGDISNILVQTLDGGYMMAGSTYSSDGDITSPVKGIYDAWIVKLESTVNIETVQSADDRILVYPTVTSGNINISLPAGYEHSSISLYNILGQPFNINISGTGRDKKIRLENLQAGIYMLCIGDGNNRNSYRIIYTP